MSCVPDSQSSGRDERRDRGRSQGDDSSDERDAERKNRQSSDDSSPDPDVKKETGLKLLKTGLNDEPNTEDSQPQPQSAGKEEEGKGGPSNYKTFFFLFVNGGWVGQSKDPITLCINYSQHSNTAIRLNVVPPK